MPTRGGSPTNNDDIAIACEGQASCHGREQSREASCLCTGVKGPNGVFTNTRCHSFSRAPEAHNGSDSSKMKNAKDIDKSRKPFSASGAKTDDGEPQAMFKRQSKKSRAVPIFR